MAVTANKDIHGHAALSAAVVSLQSTIGGVPVKKYIDLQDMAAHIIALQQRMNVLYPGSVQVNTSIDDQALAAKLIAIQKAIP